MKNRKIKIVITIAAVISMILTGCANETSLHETEHVSESGEADASGDYTSNIMYSTDSNGNESATIYVFAMDTAMTLTVYGENAETALHKAAEEIMRIDRLCSIGIEDSEISKLNSNRTAEISKDVEQMIEKSLSLNEETNGAFDITIYPLMELWGFTSQEYQVPAREEIDTLLEDVDTDQIEIENGVCNIHGNAKIDLGGIAKGYTGDRVTEVLENAGISQAVISLGGNVKTLGTKDGDKWKIAIQDPEDTNGYLGVLETSDESVVTSGGYERYFEEDGNTYHHILDPASGYPADSGLMSVTIVSEDGMLADGLSTAIFVMGLDQATTYWRDHADTFDMILYTSDGKLYVTSGIADRFESGVKTEMIE